MSKITLKNCDPTGPVWVEARLSNTGIPYASLPLATGFPRWLSLNESVEIDLRGYKEVLYRRGMDYFDAQRTVHNLSHVLFRIGNPRQLEEVHGYLWEYTRSPTEPDNSSANPLEDKVDLDETIFDINWMKKRSYKSAKYFVEPFSKAQGYSNNILQIFLRVTDRQTNQTGERLIIETIHDEALSLIDKLIIKNELIIAKPRTTLWGSTFAELYRSRGFVVPVETSIKSILNYSEAQEKGEQLQGKQLP
jgi:hypothetical protein